jgi:hypothetical protein
MVVPIPRGHEPMFGICRRQSKLVFVDVDVSRAKNKFGDVTYDLLQLEYGWPPSFESKSPSGGL